MSSFASFPYNNKVYILYSSPGRIPIWGFCHSNYLMNEAVILFNVFFF